MIKLIKNELTKILKKKSFLIMISIIIAFMILFNILYLNSKNKTIKQLEELKQSIQMLDSIEDSDSEKSSEELEEVNELISDNNVTIESLDEQIKECKTSMNNRVILMDILNQYDIFIVIYIIMVAGTIISEEFNKGTIKLLLIKPYTRIQIFLAKFISCFIVLICTSLVIIFLQILIGGIILDFSSLSEPINILNHTTGEYESINVFKYIAIDFMARLPMYMIILALAFSCSSVLLNTSLSIIIPIVVYLFSGTITEFASKFEFNWMKYLVTINWNFEPFMFGGKPEMPGITMGFSIFICILYFVLIMWAATYSFKKTDIRNI